MGDGSRTFGGIWENQMHPLVEAGREWAFFVANGCGSEPNCMAEEQWDGRYPRMRKLKILEKRGCSGAKRYCGASAAGAETSELLGSGEVLPVREEGWQLHCTELHEF